jgi:DNA-binding transcriptional LysR family regulator
VATPAYLKKHGRPRSPEDLKKHHCLLFGASEGSASVRLESVERSVQVDLSPRLMVSDMDILRAATSAGLGIALLPGNFCVEDLRAHSLEHVLADWNTPTTPLHVVYPSSRHGSPTVKSFVEHLHKHMTQWPWELGPVP